ncbi:hypothetical protein [Nonomuraea typhae]|uniref:Uncharacterized protein n=1 Tax=Nonomuraea typhae TaxID=2603600 RepID=A0ABW7YJD9_9ACTN
MSTKNGSQRRHYVLAESLIKAGPIMNRLRANGLLPDNIIYVSDETTLLGLDGERCAVIYGPGYLNHPYWPTLNTRVQQLLHEGAVLKTDPEKAYRKREAERAAAKKRGEPERYAYRRDEELRLEPKGGLWDHLKSPGIACTRMSLESIGQRFYATGPDTSAYKEYYLGGPRHGKRRKALPAPSENMIETIPVHARLPNSAALPMIDAPSDVHIASARYRSYAAEILGQRVMFWVHEGSWSDRQRLARDFVLMPLEV